jgi:hypothetical protein
LPNQPRVRPPALSMQGCRFFVLPGQVAIRSNVRLSQIKTDLNALKECCLRRFHSASASVLSVPLRWPASVYPALLQFRFLFDSLVNLYQRLEWVGFSSNHRQQNMPVRFLFTRAAVSLLMECDISKPFVRNHRLLLMRLFRQDQQQVMSQGLEFLDVYGSRVSRLEDGFCRDLSSFSTGEG